ncbi:MAG TPA: HAMP domain-containing protein [Candidatus Scatomorpha merdigallinarum]|nr:HAMP domain-containing protein [Candidatus Scatomorpha merdigallinarum]
MNRSLYTKLVLIILVLIVALMLVAGVFLTRGVRSFYLNDFYDSMAEAFGDQDLAEDLRSAAAEDDPAYMSEILGANAGQLGIDRGTRNYHILSGETGEWLAGSITPENNNLDITPNIITALSGGNGDASDPNADYMDIALPVEGGSSDYIIYVIDNRETMRSLNDQLLQIIVEAMAVGLVISVFLSLLLAKTMIAPIQELTHAAEKVASGDFSDKVENSSKDEIGVLTRTFNDMAVQLEDTLDDLKRSEQMRREFVANVSHELRTPITGVKSYAETLAADPDMPADTRERFLNVILNESDRMTKIVQDLLTLSRFDAGSFEFSFDEFSFETSVRDVYNAVRMEAQAHGHVFVLEVEPGIPRIRGDKARVEQVLMNMVSNAIKYTKDGGRITIKAGVRGGEVWCSVKDNGIGIPKDDTTKVFDRFYRVDKARSRESGGTGLGLSIAQEIVVRHGGRIDLKSRLGHGTTITVWLPVEGPQDA